MASHAPTRNTQASSRSSTWGWRILVAVCALLVLNGGILFFFIADSELMRLVSIMESGSALMALAVAWEGLRHGTRWAWKALWIYFGLLLALALQMLLGGGGVGLYYLSLAGFVLAGQLLARRKP